ncbi:MAG: TRAP transporter small permease [Thermodesulfobacteriota bacterium]
MPRFLEIIRKISATLNTVAGCSLLLLMTLTIADIILRLFKNPIVGTYELVAYAGAVALGFSIPYTSWARGHIYVDFFTGKLPMAGRRIFHVATRLLGMALFLLIGWNLIKMGKDLQISGEVSLTLQFPFFYIVYGLGGVCLLQIFVLFADIFKVLAGNYE